MFIGGAILSRLFCLPMFWVLDGPNKEIGKKMKNFFILSTYSDQIVRGIGHLTLYPFVGREARGNTDTHTHKKKKNFFYLVNSVGTCALPSLYAIL